MVAQRFGPLVEERLRARKRAAGLFDFDDMLLLVDEALRGPRGAELAATLRARFRLAVIDEFQDTDPVQWQIFRTIFLDGGDPRPLYLVGDPKQSIYGFRGADVSTYDGARAAVTALGGVHHLERNFRSTPAVIDTYNAIFDQKVPKPFFSAGMTYDHPVTYGGKESETGRPDAASHAAPRAGRRREEAADARRARPRWRAPSPTRSPICWPGPTSPARATSSC